MCTLLRMRKRSGRREGVSGGGVAGADAGFRCDAAWCVERGAGGGCWELSRPGGDSAALVVAGWSALWCACLSELEGGGFTGDGLATSRLVALFMIEGVAVLVSDPSDSCFRRVFARVTWCPSPTPSDSSIPWLLCADFGGLFWEGICFPLRLWTSFPACVDFACAAESSRPVPVGLVAGLVVRLRSEGL